MKEATAAGNSNPGTAFTTVRKAKGEPSHTPGADTFFSLYQQSPLIPPPTHALVSLPLSLLPPFCLKRLAAPSGSWCRNFSKQCSSPLCGMKKEAKL